MTPQEAADFLRISKRTLHQLCRDGRIAYVQVDGKNRRFLMEQLEEYTRAKVRPAKTEGAISPATGRKNHLKVATSTSSPRCSRENLKEEMKKWR